MKYIVSYTQPSSHLIDIEFIVESHLKDQLEVHLPAWRPGRYELGNFAKNIQSWKAFDSKGNQLKSLKTSKDSWLIETPGITEIHIKYNYFAYQLDAGACWLDDSQLYINGVHCFLYVSDRMDEVCELTVKVPEHWTIASGMRNKGNNELQVPDFHTLVDSPFIASPDIKHNSFSVKDVLFNLWIQGECKPDWERIIRDFSLYTEEQIETMGSFPVSEYHYLIQVLPNRFYHGVEHLNSTVIAIGPGYNLMKGDTYEDFLGVNSHELFHSWNIKTIRPVEMLPYEYKRENYFRTGFVAEGITTYYGDLFLIRSGVYTIEQYFTELNQRFQRHFDNYGRHSMPVAEASYDTWLDGYTPGIPNRKTSIYDEGSICALMLDLTLVKHSNGKVSLDDVMRSLYLEAQNGKGYSETSFRNLCESLGGKEALLILDNYVYGTQDYEPKLLELLALAGCSLSKTPSPVVSERYYGFKTLVEGGVTKIAAIAPGSVAEGQGLSKDAEIITVNGFKVENNLNDWLHYFQGSAIQLQLSFQKRVLSATLSRTAVEYYQRYKTEKIKGVNEEQQLFFKRWTKNSW